WNGNPQFSGWRSPSDPGGRVPRPAWCTEHRVPCERWRRPGRTLRWQRLLSSQLRGAGRKEGSVSCVFSTRGVLAEGVGVDPTVPCGTTVFKTAALNHSATPPRLRDDKLRGVLPEAATEPGYGDVNREPHAGPRRARDPRQGAHSAEWSRRSSVRGADAVLPRSRAGRAMPHTCVGIGANRNLSLRSGVPQPG